jgi:hydrogenase maturation protease
VPEALPTAEKTERPAERAIRLAIIGIGNVLAGDDGAGVELVRRLEARNRGETRYFFTSVQGGVDLLEIFPHADIVLIADAVQSGAPPGTIRLLPLPSPHVIPRSQATLSNHGWGLSETLELAAALRQAVPPLWLLGIEVGTVKQGESRSPEVERAIASAADDFPSIEARLKEYAPIKVDIPER